MTAELKSRATARVDVERWPLRSHFQTAAQTIDAVEVVAVHVEQLGQVGRGEAAGVYYLSETATSIASQIQSLQPLLERGVDRATLQTLLPPGGARNALDCAFWELESKLLKQPVWKLAGLDEPHPLQTLLTCGADSPENMATQARSYVGAGAIKLKMTGEPIDAERVRAVRQERPEVLLTIDCNQGFTLPTFTQLLPTLIEMRVAHIEQPFPIEQDALLDHLDSPIPIIADESVQSLEDISKVANRFDVINIKLDKSGGLTEALAMVRLARRLGLATYVGNMFGTSLAMAPAFLVGQLCDIVELDGPLFMAADRAHRVRYKDGYIHCPPDVWGNSQADAEQGSCS